MVDAHRRKCEAEKNCTWEGKFWVQTNLPRMVSDVREGEHGVKPDRNLVTCAWHLPGTIERIRQLAIDAIRRIVGNVHTGWKGVTVKMHNGKCWR